MVERWVVRSLLCIRPYPAHGLPENVWPSPPTRRIFGAMPDDFDARVRAQDAKTFQAEATRAAKQDENDRAKQRWTQVEAEVIDLAERLIAAAKREGIAPTQHAQAAEPAKGRGRNRMPGTRAVPETFRIPLPFMDEPPYSKVHMVIHDGRFKRWEADKRESDHKDGSTNKTYSVFLHWLAPKGHTEYPDDPIAPRGWDSRWVSMPPLDRVEVVRERALDSLAQLASKHALRP